MEKLTRAQRRKVKHHQEKALERKNPLTDPNIMRQYFKVEYRLDKAGNFEWKVTPKYHEIWRDYALSKESANELADTILSTLPLRYEGLKNELSNVLDIWVCIFEWIRQRFAQV